MFVKIKNSLNIREHGLKTLALSFNREVQTMGEIQTRDRRYKKRAVPRSIDVANLFNTDVTSSIWDSFGLDDSDDEDAPLWQSDEQIKHGVVDFLDSSRCNEEEERIWWEISSLTQWAVSEAQSIAAAWTSHGKSPTLR
jgi:hypothetical protein